MKKSDASYQRLKNDDGPFTVLQEWRCEALLSHQRIPPKEMECWPVVAEARALVRARDQVRVLDWIIGAGIEVVSIDDGADFIRSVMTAYRDLPFDFADASIVYAS